jgi:hypothetical protein
VPHIFCNEPQRRESWTGCRSFTVRRYDRSEAACIPESLIREKRRSIAKPCFYRRSGDSGAALTAFA